MIRLTPVTASKARMLRPSRPMMRPFMSSLGQGEHAHGRLRGLLGGDPLDRDGDDLAGALLALLAGPLLESRDLAHRVAFGVLHDLRDEWSWASLAVMAAIFSSCGAMELGGPLDCRRT